MPSDSHLEASVNNFINTLSKGEASPVPARWMRFAEHCAMTSPGRGSKLLEFVDVRGTRVRVAPLDQPVPDEARKRFLEGERTTLARDGDLLVQVLQRVAPDVLACPITDHQQLSRRHHAAADARQQSLCDHRGE